MNLAKRLSTELSVSSTDAVKRKMPMITGLSRSCAAAISRLPVPGQLKTNSAVTTAVKYRLMSTGSLMKISGRAFLSPWNMTM